MLEIVQAGQAGKTSLLFKMHRLRKHIFVDRMRWDISANEQDLEIDNFDLPETVYLLALDEAKSVIGSWRLLSTTKTTMIQKVWPEFLNTLPIDINEFSWEASRFGVNSSFVNKRMAFNQISAATAILFCGMAELCLLCGIEKIYTIYDERISKILKRVDCRPSYVSAEHLIDGRKTVAGCFLMNREMITRIRKATGYNSRLVIPEMLPPILQKLRHHNMKFIMNEIVTSSFEYAA